jgi:peptidoglycan/xylan/chitin deacetylase (PgdA/CDA1 family)
MPGSPIRTAVKITAAAVDRLRPPRRGVVVLIYHRVGGRSGLSVDLPIELFEEQMAALSDTGRAASLDQALNALTRAAPPPVDPVVVTFDDGTADLAEIAMPVLEHHKVPVTVYVATEFIESARNFPHGGRPLSWVALRDLVTSGLVTVGSHTHTHALLDRLATHEVDDELDRSIALIGERLGVAAEHFAYPKALPGTPEAEAAVRRRFRSAALAGTRSNTYGSTDPHHLSRSPIQRFDGMRWFRRKAAGGMAFEDSLRRLLDRRRHADAIT